MLLNLTHCLTLGLVTQKMIEGNRKRWLSQAVWVTSPLIVQKTVHTLMSIPAVKIEADASEIIKQETYKLTLKQI